MASSKGTKKTNKAVAQQKKSTGRPATDPSKYGVKPSVYRQFSKEIWAVVCLILGIAILFSSFDGNSVLARLFKGLVGEIGMYILPIGLVLCFITLMFHGGRPVAMRLICSLAFALLASSVFHLAVDGPMSAEDGSLIALLYTQGKSGGSGGVFGGLIAILFGLIGGIPCAWAISIILLIVTLPASLNLTLTGLLRAINHHREQENNAQKKEYREPAEVLVEHISQRRADRNVRKGNRRRFDYDLPVDEPQAVRASGEKKTEQRSVPSPDEFIREKRTEKKRTPQSTAAELTAAAEETTAQESPKLYEVQVPEKQPAPEPEMLPAQKKAAEPVKMPPLVLEDAPEKVKPEDARRSAAEIAMEIESRQAEEPELYTYPSADLLNPAGASAVDGTSEMRENTKRLKETLECFNVDAEIINVTRGPSVTMYELELAQGVRLNRLTGLADDIALSLGAPGVRISAIPDKISVVGIEVPNKLVSTVSIREVIDSAAFRNAPSKISFAVGKDISGSCIVGDIAKLPHMLIAGTTGSGKSVCMNSLIISLLFKATPDEVRLIMVDPKMVELGIYNGIPHLLIPVVTEPKKAAGALQWTVTEMMRRYRVMSEAGVRDLESYNRQAVNLEGVKPMEQIVVVIDELADLMLVAAKEVEESICRIAQMGRASGIHLVIATQRPSADVITGLMKANIPSRIAFAVSSAMESRIILDTMGAEKLVGKGDMLFAPLGKGKPKRVQGCFITEDEVQRVVEFIKNHCDANYSEDVQAQIDLKAEQQGSKGRGSTGLEDSGAGKKDSDGDELLPAAVEVILETGQASVSMLQRRLKLGYARAARIVDEMEERGIVGPFEGSKPRQLLITKEQWQAMQSGAQMPVTVQDDPPVEEELM